MRFLIFFLIYYDIINIGGIMEIGHSKTTDMVLRYISDEKKQEMEDFISEIFFEKFLEIKNNEQLKSVFKDNLYEFLNSVTQDELLDLRTYTGYNFKNINAILRNNWAYEENGLLTEEQKRKFLILSQKISEIIKKFPRLPYNFITYRGTTLSSFSKYGISNINDLQSLKGNYMYEEGFTSTSVIEDTCYFNKQLETGLNYNIKLKYLVSSEYDEGVLLQNNDMSYSTNQNEYLINKGSLSKVIDVNVDKELNQAELTLVIVPRKKWDIVKENENKVR